jgi:CubicO group peptidase (beta-lactamase class C family)
MRRNLVIVFVLACVSAVLIGDRGGAAQNRAQLGIKPQPSKLHVSRPDEEMIIRLMREGDVPGLSIVLIRNSRIYWYRGFGVKNADTKAPIDNATVFETASLTKPVLAYAVLKLVDSGKLDLDTPLAKYLPGNYVEDDPRSALITARMVLTHTTGFQNELHPGEKLQIHFIPGQRFSYSGEGFIYLQKVVEHISGERFDLFMKKNVFDPLRMTSASYSWRDEYETSMANGHSPSGIVADRIKPQELKLSWLHMNVLDYAKFVIAVMNGDGLKPLTAKLMLTPQVKLDESCVFCLTPGAGRISSSLSWGLGWGIERTELGDAFWHWGENRGEFHTFAMGYPKQKTGIVIFTNSGNGLSIIPEIVSDAIGGTHPSFKWMGYDLYNSPQKIQFRANVRPVKALFDEILREGVAAVERYRQSHKSTSKQSGLSEQQINTLGYWLKGKKRLTEAIAVFKINTEDFPESWNAFDSLGEAYMDNGDKELAIRNYQKSVELNPKNLNAVEMIKKLQN